VLRAGISTGVLDRSVIGMLCVFPATGTDSGMAGGSTEIDIPGIDTCPVEVSGSCGIVVSSGGSGATGPGRCFVGAEGSGKATGVCGAETINVVFTVTKAVEPSGTGALGQCGHTWGKGHG
jgi:hypothetical protein